MNDPQSRMSSPTADAHHASTPRAPARRKRPTARATTTPDTPTAKATHAPTPFPAPPRARLVAGATLFLLALLAGGAWAADAMADRVAIEELWSKYAVALDTADPDLYASLFTPEAYLEVDGKPYRGHAAIQALIRDIRQKNHIDELPADAHGRRFGPIRHLLSNLSIELKGDHATSESYWTEIITNGKSAQGVGNPPSVLKMGRYEDSLVKKDGKWLYEKRIISGDLQMDRPTLK